VVGRLQGPERERVGQRLGRYELRYLVAQGGMASVYLAQLASGEDFARWFAVKVMHAHLADDEGEFVRMFRDEARLAARIQHPNVCQVLDFGEQDGTHYLVMEYLHGETLSALIRRSWQERGELSPALVATLLAMVARGLHAAHQLRGRDRELLNVVHRDVTPQNMMVLYDGLAKITDFGIARAPGRLAITRPGVLKGKFAYMCPEQVNGEALDHRSDLWGLGVVLWEATLGRHLFRSRSDGETAMKVVEMPIPRPTELLPGYPPALEEIVMSALQRDPGARVSSAERFAARLEAFAREQRERWGPAEIAAHMATLFVDRLEQRDEMLNADLEELDAGITVVDFPSESGSSSGVQVREPGDDEEPDDEPTRAMTPSLPFAAPEITEVAPARRQIGRAHV
jgi:eukaryotic-like serine/threonine-protein kinase